MDLAWYKGTVIAHNKHARVLDGGGPEDNEVIIKKAVEKGEVKLL